MRLLYKTVTGLIVALGIIHIGFTPFNYGRFDMDAVWFVGTGMAIVLAGFLNFVVIREAGRDALVRTLCFVSNCTFALLFGVALFQMHQPQVILGLAVFALAAVCVNFTSAV